MSFQDCDCVTEHISHSLKQEVDKASLNYTKEPHYSTGKTPSLSLGKVPFALVQQTALNISSSDQRSMSDALNLVFLPGRTDSIHTGAWPRSVKPKLLLPL